MRLCHKREPVIQTAHKRNSYVTVTKFINSDLYVSDNVLQFVRYHLVNVKVSILFKVQPTPGSRNEIFL